MKKKIITNTYLNETIKYEIKLFLDEDDYYVSVKKLVHLSEKLINEIKTNTNKLMNLDFSKYLKGI